jgi:tetrahydromethanopterin S-methyltransferase subunit F
MHSLAIVFAAAVCAGCAGRAPTPVAVVQPQDRFMDCPAILAEVQSNNSKVEQLARDKGLKTGQNVAAGVAGLFIPILWFGMDFQGTADKEVAALQNRAQYLAVLAEQRQCGAPTPQAAPPVAR